MFKERRKQKRERREQKRVRGRAWGIEKDEDTNIMKRERRRLENQEECEAQSRRPASDFRQDFEHGQESQSRSHLSHPLPCTSSSMLGEDMIGKERERKRERDSKKENEMMMLMT